MKHLVRTLSLLAALFLMVGAAAQAQSADAGGPRPLLQPGKDTLYQRVLMREGAVVRDAPRTGAAPAARTGGFQTFTPLYVYNRVQAGGETWLAVSPSENGGARGWLQESRSLEWNTSIVVTFNNPATRINQRALIFETREALRDHISNRSAAELADLRERATAVESGAQAPGYAAPVAAIEPDTHVSLSDNFYIFPILDFEEHGLPRGSGIPDALALNVATLRRDANAQPSPTAPDALSDFRMGVVFVVDTTQSMQPYIDATREMMERITDSVDAAQVDLKLSYGLVGFRDNTRLASNIDYTARTYLDLDAQSDGRALVDALRRMQAAQASTEGFSEDSLAGVDHAINALSWDKVDGRMVILITDASPRLDANSAVTGGVQAVVNAAQARSISLQTIHLETQEGANDWTAARTAYRALSRGLAVPTLMESVDTSSPSHFSAVAESVARGLVEVAISAQNNAPPRNPGPSSGANTTQQNQLIEGLAMQLAYLGRIQGTTAPDLVQGWLLEYNLPLRTEAKVVEVNLMLSRPQLSSLVTRMEIIAAQADRLSNPADSADFISDLQAALSAAATDANQLSYSDDAELRDAASELLEDLPYTSPTMGLTPREVASMSPMGLGALRDTIRRRAEVLRRIYDDPRSWHPPYQPDPSDPNRYEAPQGEWLTLIPLENLP